VECLLGARNTFAPACTMGAANWTTPPYSSIIAPRQIVDARRDHFMQRALFLRSPAEVANARLAASIARRASSSSASVYAGDRFAVCRVTISMTSRPWDSANAPSIVVRRDCVHACLSVLKIWSIKLPFRCSAASPLASPRCLEVCGQLFLGVENSPLDRPDRDRFFRGDNVIQ